MSNAAWLGRGGKREGVEAHDVLLLNRELLKAASDAWTDDAIRARTDELANVILQIWPVPEGHRSGFVHDKPKPRRKARVADLIATGWLSSGLTLFPRRSKFAGRVATLLADGQIDVDGTPYRKPNAAAAAITGKRTHGMSFFLVDQEAGRSLRDVWREYVDTLAGEVEDDDEEEDADEGDEER